MELEEGKTYSTQEMQRFMGISKSTWDHSRDKYLENFCLYYEYDEDYECYVCEVNLDEDEMARFMEDRFYDCPYYRLGDEYMIVRKQM